MSSLAAGAVGSLITLVVAFLARLSAVPAEVSSNDRRTRDRDDDLGRWIADRDVWLRRELRQLRQSLSARGALDSGDYGYQLGLAKEKALHEWRDQELQARRDVAGIYDREGLLHRAWRLGAGRPPELRTPELARPVLDAWREPPSRPQERDQAWPIDDPTERTLDRLVHEVAGRLRAYQ